jgi:hypothetical protein
MEHAYPHLVPVEASLVIANVLPSGSAFGVRMDNGENCYIPVNVATATQITVGMEITAKLVPNRFPDKAERTPWLTVFLSRNPSPIKTSVPVQYAMPFEQFDIEPSAPAEPSMADKVRGTMRKGGVWTVSSLYSELVPGKVRTDGLTEYNAISAAVRAMYARGECAKFQLWRTSDQSKPSREWFTCHPDKADVDEWEEQ